MAILLERWTPLCWLVAVLVLLFGTLACAPPDVSELTTAADEPSPTVAPNVVLIVVDTLRADHLSQYGYPRDTSPALESFARQATLFQNAYAPANWTTPSAASLFTGLDPARHQLRGAGDALPEDAWTFVQYLSDAGYDAYGDSANINVSRELGFDRGFRVWHQPEAEGAEVLAYPGIDQMLEKFSSWVERMNGEGRYLTYLHPMNVHGPYRVPKEHQSALLGHPPDRTFVYYGDVMGKVLAGRLQQRSHVSPRYLKSLFDQYDTAIRYTTDQVGEMLDLLRASDLYDDSLIILTSDHGEELFDHGGFSHGYTVYEEIVRVPLIVKLPSQREARTVGATVMLQDLMPTIVELAGLEVPPDLDGRSLTPLLSSGGDAAWEEPGEGTRLHHGTARKRCDCRALVEGDKKLIVNASSYQFRRGAVELYDLKEDPGERENIANADREQTQAMIGRFEAAVAKAMEKRVEGGENVLDSMDKERLEALGYLDSPDN